MSDQNVPEWPAFLREIDGTLAATSQYVLHGAIRDRVLRRTPTGPELLDLQDALWMMFARSGYSCLIWYDHVHGITAYPNWSPHREAAERLLGRETLGSWPQLSDLRTVLATAVGTAPPTGPGQTTGQPAGATATRPRVVVVIDYASRLLSTPQATEATEREFFLFCQKMAVTAVPYPTGLAERPGDLYNPVLWLVDGERDLPPWYAASIEQIRTVGVPAPSLSDRKAATAYIAKTRFGVVVPERSDADRHRPETPEERQVGMFTRGTEGLSLQAMESIASLALDRRLPLASIDDAIRIYKLGIEDNPWMQDSIHDAIKNGEKTVPEKVLGQERAVVKTLDILKRAALGLSGAQATSTASRPRGVLFFAGPTGVGKTELAKQVAALLFGDSDAYLRFDMSEFSAEHSADRLTGAPPGYVGFEAGGELTRAIRQRPFQVVLFDEIEKAHPRVLDKFLQILEDGRLTDGQGTTTYFSECVLIFTSNLGVIETDPQTKEKRQVLFANDYPRERYDDLDLKVRDGIRKHFTNVMGRPELLNRFGDNVVVFAFVDQETADRIFELQLGYIGRALDRERRTTLHLSDSARHRLRELCTENLDNGGRGIGNKLETNLINPLARFIFDRTVPPGVELTIKEILTGVPEVGVELVADFDARGAQ
jgi:hypothetical protein